jgi:ferredoxin-thioredoxin reductase catalytic subunit
MEWYDKYAAKVGIALNPNEDHVKMIVAGLEQRKETMGARYCPCVPAFACDRTNVCPCKDLRNSLTRDDVDCKCELFVKPLKDNRE